MGDATDDVLAEAALRSARGIEQPIQMPKAPHRIRVAAGSMLALYGLLTLGAQGIAALGVGVAEPPKQAHHRVYLGVRLTADELASPRIRARLDRMHATAIIDATTARAAERPIRLLVAREIDVGNGGWGQGRAFRPLRAQADVVSTTDVINKTAAVKIREFVPERRFDAFDQLFARRRGQRLVQADHVIRPGVGARTGCGTAPSTCSTVGVVTPRRWRRRSPTSRSSSATTGSRPDRCPSCDEARARPPSSGPEWASPGSRRSPCTPRRRWSRSRGSVVTSRPASPGSACRATWR